MILHLFKLVWNRKRTNFLLVVEIFCAFLVVFSLTTAGILLFDRYSDNLGFDSTDVWQVQVARNTTGWGPWSQPDADTFRRLIDAANEMDEVLAVSGANTAPYRGSQDITSWEYEKRTVRAEVSTVTPGFIDVVGLDLIGGRWFGEEDTALDYTPIVIDRELAFELMGDEDPIGKRVTDDAEQDYRVIGMVSDYRRGGEFDENLSYMFNLAQVEEGGRTLEVILLKTAPGTRADFEEVLVRKLQSIARDWSFNVSMIETIRESYLKQRLIPLGVIGLVAAFLLAMVVLGLTGVMWQNVTRRTREIGLRRAAGAHRARIHRQIVGEVMVTASLGLVVGTLIAVQVPLIGPFTFVPFAVVIPAVILAGLLILLLAGLCGLYPGWSATRIQPAEALHYE